MTLARGTLAASVPFVVLTLGAFVAHGHGVSWFAFAPNLVAAVLGVGVLLALHRRRVGHAELVGVTAAVMLAAPLAFAEEGVHRWVFLGPLRLHVSQLVLPIVIWALGAMRSRTAKLSAVAIVSLLHVLQPDAGQATAFALAACVVFATTDETLAFRAIGVAVAVAAAVVAWLRPDALEAVPHVERIVHLAFATSAALGVAAVLSLGLLVAPFASLRGAPFAAYLVATVAVTEVGFFPVPVLGAGASPVLGWFACLALLRATDAWRAAAPTSR